MNVFYLLIFVFSVSKCGAKSLTKEVFRRAAEQCCTAKRVECCMDMLTFGKPIRCGYEAFADLPQQVYECLQDRLFADEPEKKTKLDDSHCCAVFAYDGTDASHRCEAACKTIMAAPSLSAQQKMERIKQCSLLENPFLKCFDTCRSMRSRGCRFEVVRFEEFCDARNATTSSAESHIEGC